MTHGQDTRASAWPIGDGNSAYLDKTLCYQDVELSLSEGVSWRVLAQLWLRATIAACLVLAVSLPLAMLLLLVRSLIGAVAIFLVGSLLGFVLFWIVLLTSRIVEPIAEWRVLLADRANTADSVYSQISGTLSARRLPLGWSVRRIRTGPGPTDVRNRLVLRHESYTVYVSVFPYGTSLYLGWMMWRSRNGSALFGQFMRDLGHGMTGANDPERQMLRTEGVRAMREAVHAACREGLFVGYGGVAVPVEYGFPYGLPPVEDDLASAPVPGMPPPPPVVPAPGSW